MRKTGWITLAACSLLIAACGSSGDPGSSHAGFDAGLAFSRCMRAHGVPNFPDPSSGGGGFRIQIKVGSGIDPFSPSFRAAQAACHKLLPGGGPGAGHPSAQAKAQMLQISQCMRRHGIAGFPDPTTSPPSGPTRDSAVLGHDGVFLVIPNTIDTQSPAFQQAATACGFAH
jgi:hypothetical protein